MGDEVPDTIRPRQDWPSLMSPGGTKERAQYQNTSCLTNRRFWTLIGLLGPLVLLGLSNVKGAPVVHSLELENDEVYRLDSLNLTITGNDEQWQDLFLTAEFRLDPELWVELGSYDLGHGIRTLSVSDDGNYTFLADPLGKVLLFDKETELLWSYDTGARVNTLHISPTGNYMAAGNLDGKVFYWHASSSEPLWNASLPDSVDHIRLAEMGKSLIVATSHLDNGLYYLRGADGTTEAFDLIGDTITEIEISEDGRYYVAGSHDKRARLYQRGVHDGQPTETMMLGNQIRSVAISASGSIMAFGAINGELELYDIENGTSLWHTNLNGEVIRSMDLSDDGNHLGVFAGKRLYYFTKNSSVPVWTELLSAYSGTIDMSSDGQLLVAATLTSPYYVYFATTDGSDPIISRRTKSPTKISHIDLADDTMELMVANADIESTQTGKVVRLKTQELIDSISYFNNSWSGVVEVPITTPTGTYTVWGRLVNPEGEASQWYEANTTLKIKDHPPFVTLLPPSNQQTPHYDTSPIQLIGEIRDPEGFENYYNVAWYVDDELYSYYTLIGPSYQPSVSIEPLSEGSHKISLIVDTPLNEAVEANLTIQVQKNPPPTPQWLSLSNQSLYRGQTFTLSTLVEDEVHPPENLTLEFGFKEEALVEQILELDIDGRVQAYHFSESGQLLLAQVRLETRDELYLIDLKNKTYSRHTMGDFLDRLEIVGDLEYVVAVEDHYNDQIFVFERVSGEDSEILTLLWASPQGWGSILDMDFTRDGQHFVVGTTNVGRVYFFSLYDSSPLWSTSTLGPVSQVLVSPDGNFIAAYLDNLQSILLYSGDGALVQAVPDIEGGITSLQFSDTGRYLLATFSNQTSVLFDNTTYEPVWAISPELMNQQLPLGIEVTRIYNTRLAGSGERVLFAAELGGILAGNHVIVMFHKDEIGYEWFASSDYPISHLEFSPDQQKVLVVGDGEGLTSGFVSQLDLHSGKKDWQWITTGDIRLVEFNEQRQVYLLIDSQTGQGAKLAKLDLPSGDMLWSRDYIISPTAFELNSLGTFLLVRTAYELELLEAVSGTKVWASVSPEGQGLVGLSRDGLVFSSHVITEDGIPGDHSLKIYSNKGLIGLEPPWFSQGVWHLNVTLNHFFGLGNFTPGLRFLDPDGALSPWHYVNGTLLVLNNPPIAGLKPLLKLNEGALVPAQGQDVDGHIVNYRWVSEKDGNWSNQALLDTNGLSFGTQNLSLQVQDNDGNWSAPVAVSFHLNGRPLAQLMSWPAQPVRKGEWVTLIGQGHDVDRPEPLALQLWEVGPLRMTRSIGQTLQFDTSLLRPGNHTIRYLVQDTEGAWSLPQTGWIFVNGHPTALIVQMNRLRVDGRDVITLWGNGSDESAVQYYQWRSDRDGPLGQGELLVLDNLSKGSHIISLRVRDDSGLWSPWVAAHEPLLVKASDDQGSRWGIFTERGFYATLLLLYLFGGGAWIVSRPWRNRWMAQQVKYPTLEVWKLQNSYIARGLELEFPRQAMGQAFEPLTSGRYWLARRRLDHLKEQASGTLDLFEQCFYLRQELSKLVEQTPKTRLRAHCPPRKLERLEYLYMVRRLQEYKDQASELIDVLSNVRQGNLATRGLHRPSRGPMGLGSRMNSLTSRRWN